MNKENKKQKQNEMIETHINAVIVYRAVQSTVLHYLTDLLRRVADM